jgi:hypothetical protein
VKVWYPITMGRDYELTAFQLGYLYGLSDARSLQRVRSTYFKDPGWSLLTSDISDGSCANGVSTTIGRPHTGLGPGFPTATAVTPAAAVWDRRSGWHRIAATPVLGGQIHEYRLVEVA